MLEVPVLLGREQNVAIAGINLCLYRYSAKGRLSGPHRNQLQSTLILIGQDVPTGLYKEGTAGTDPLLLHNHPAACLYLDIFLLCPNRLALTCVVHVWYAIFHLQVGTAPFLQKKRLKSSNRSNCVHFTFLWKK